MALGDYIPRPLRFAPGTPALYNTRQKHNTLRTVNSASLSGSAVHGQTMSVVFNGQSTRSLTYQWVRGASTNIAGANKQSYTVQAGDVGSTLKCVVSYTGGSVTTAPSAVVT